MWPGWRGPRRDGSTRELPASLPSKVKQIWNYALAFPGLGGIASTSKNIVFGDRDLTDQKDVFRSLSARDGKLQWRLEYFASGELDYGPSPRATPLIHNDLVFLLGAFGHLHCVELSTGKIVWKKNLYDEYGLETKPTWGACSSPLIVENKLIVNPGAKEASLVALDPKTGKTLWKTPGEAAGYGSLIAGKFGGRLQIVGHDAISLGGWDVKTGKRLWKVIPEFTGDFNVPTPLAVNGNLLVTTENNGTRLYAFDTNGIIQPKPIAINEDLNPDMSSPILIGDSIYCVWNEMFCLDSKQELKTKCDMPPLTETRA
ncbi:MAG: PQQ-like beta-propeller repeat protein [Planctomycetes bacterium]|nr:PQQ-like beta-propeller repeat protein [Planctomycetota bacterium]MCH9726392.1 PQQ-like beta-propeller repeat protein [Planctomycetota bacterium]MCH9779177.1 PQQ-like beta-propeller repeat protein [Planctomycetota bacterium]